MEECKAPEPRAQSPEPRAQSPEPRAQSLLLSMHRTALHHARIELDFAECAFISGDIVLENAQQGLGLLGAQIDSLEILNFDLSLALLEQRPEDQEKIPDIYPNLHAIRVVFPIIAGICQLYIGRYWIGHRAISVAVCHGGRKGDNLRGEQESDQRNRLYLCGYESIVRLVVA